MLSCEGIYFRIFQDSLICQLGFWWKCNWWISNIAGFCNPGCPRCFFRETKKTWARNGLSKPQNWKRKKHVMAEWDQRLITCFFPWLLAGCCGWPMPLLAGSQKGLFVGVICWAIWGNVYTISTVFRLPPPNRRGRTLVEHPFHWNFPSGEPSKKQGKGEWIFGTCLERQLYEVFCLLMIQVDGSTFSWNSLKSTRESMKLFFLGHQKHDFSRDCSLIFFGRKFSRGGGKNSSPLLKGGGCWNIESLAAFFTQNLLQDPWDFRFKPEVLPMGESLQPTKTGSNVSTRVHRK